MSLDRNCIDCGAPFTVSAPTSKSRRCRACQHKHNRLKQAEWESAHRGRNHAGKSDKPAQRINFGMAHTLEETAQMLGTSRQRVQQIERGALLKLRKAFAELGLNSVAEVLG